MRHQGSLELPRSPEISPRPRVGSLSPTSHRSRGLVQTTGSPTSGGVTRTTTVRHHAVISAIPFRSSCLARPPATKFTTPFQPTLTTARSTIRSTSGCTRTGRVRADALFLDTGHESGHEGDAAEADSLESDSESPRATGRLALTAGPKSPAHSRSTSATRTTAASLTATTIVSGLADRSASKPLVSDVLSVALTPASTASPQTLSDSTVRESPHSTRPSVRPSSFPLPLHLSSRISNALMRLGLGQEMQRACLLSLYVWNVLVTLDSY